VRPLQVMLSLCDDESWPRFEPALFSSSTAGAGGTVTKNPDLATYSHGTSVTLTATPNVGYSFAGWSGDLSGSTNPATITMDGNKTITATFTYQYTPRESFDSMSGWTI